MNRLIILALTIVLNISHGQIELEVAPVEPIAGDSFNVYFKIKGDSADEPVISFDPQGLEVLGRVNQGTTTRSTYINGKFSVEREVVYMYEMVATSTGLKRLKNIQVEFAGKKLTHSDLPIRVISKPKELSSIFAKAIVDKDQVFVGESVIVRYYLYYSTNVTNFDIVQFPKLDKFIKRYVQEKGRTERVSIGNQIYNRNLIYTAQLFAEKSGKFKIDSMKLSVHYADRRSSPFGSFGGLGAQMRKKSVSSPGVPVEVVPLPTEGMPKSFTGLVGKHQFSFELNKEKFLVNEPVEMKLTITGTGNLESFEAPQILESTAFEEFETGGDLKLNPDFTATKIFDYTYLARNNVELPAKRYPLTYFDPATLQYTTEYLELPNIEVKGSGSAGAPIPKDNIQSPDQTQALAQMNSKNTTVNFEIAPRSYLAPIFAFDLMIKDYMLPINFALVLLFFVLLIYLIWKNRYYFSDSRQDIYKLQRTLQKELDYSSLYQFLSKLPLVDMNKIGSRDMSLVEKIKASGLSEKSKEYFINTLQSLENLKFATDLSLSSKYLQTDLSYQDKPFKEALKMIQKSHLVITQGVLETREDT